MGRLLFILLSVFIFSAAPSVSQIFVGAGPSYCLPLGRNSELNEGSIGGMLQLESQKYCNLWYGLRLDYISYEKFPDAADYLEDAFMLSPEVRYVFNGGNCREETIRPYLQMMLNLSSIGATDKSNRLGIGGAAGGGLNMPFTVFNKCWSLDLNALYSVPNFIVRTEGRVYAQSLLLNISLNVGL